MILTFAGDLGSGKSTVCKLLQEQLNYERISVGDTWRALAKEKNFSIFEMNAYVLKHPEKDREMDELTAAKAREHKDCVVEGRAQWHFLPESFKIYLKIDIDEAAKRIYLQKRESEKENNSLEATKEKLIQRTQQDKQRFQKLYNINYTDKENYDLIIDTSHKTPQEVVDEIITRIS